MLTKYPLNYDMKTNKKNCIFIYFLSWNQRMIRKETMYSSDRFNTLLCTDTLKTTKIIGLTANKSFLLLMESLQFIIIHCTHLICIAGNLSQYLGCWFPWAVYAHLCEFAYTAEVLQSCVNMWVYFYFNMQWINISCITHSLTHWGWVMYICISNLSNLGSDNGLSPSQRQAII